MANRWKWRMKKFGKNIDDIFKRHLINRFNFAAVVIDQLAVSKAKKLIKIFCFNYQENL